MRTGTGFWSTVVTIASICLGAGPPEAKADACTGKDATCIDADNLWLRPGSSDHLAVGSGLTTPPGQVSFGIFASYSSRPITLHAESVDPAGRNIRVLDNLLDASLLLGVGVTDRFELTLVAPTTLYQDGAALNTLTGAGAVLPRSVLRDPRFGFAYAFLPRRRQGIGDGFSILGRMEFSAPLGDGSAFARARTMTAVPAVTGQLKLGRFEGSVEVGARLRGNTTFASADWGSQITTALAASVVVWEKNHLTVGAEAFALPTITAQKDVPALVPAEWMAESTIAPVLAGDISFTVAGGGALPFTASTLTEPRFRFTGGIRYAPRGTDRDGDGVLDRNDRCPDQPEDKDGFQDSDGCPDPDNDKDGIPDQLDRCRDEAEDKDGFQDADGCPDLDDDKDGIPDTEDACRMEPEDKNGFQDEDGCPDGDKDTDKDGIPGKRDLCPNTPEDIDGFQDADGCPDLDNDQDGIPDATDQCPNEAEDKDGFQDADGCPDPDNDQDGIPDVRDLCPNDPETINGIQDEDGCPEPGKTSLVKWNGPRVSFIETPLPKGSGRFETGRAKPTSQLEKELSMMAQLVRGRGKLARILIETFADRPSDTSEKATDLAGARATSARAVFVAAGIPVEQITAVAGDPSPKRPAASPQIEVTVQVLAGSPDNSPVTSPGASPRKRQNPKPKE